jgi:hypothetical protein
MTAPTYAALLGFSEDELALNRAGRLSNRQQAMLGKARRQGRAGLLVMLVVLLAFVGVAAAIVVPTVSKQKDASGVSAGPIVVAALVFVLLIVGLSLLRSRRRLNRLASGRVHQAVGPAQTRVRRLRGNVEADFGPEAYTDGANRYELTIGTTTFFVAGPQVLQAFEGPGTYRAYFAAGGGHAVLNRLLSVERIG